MKQLTITVDESEFEFLASQAKASGHCSPEEYVRGLVLDDHWSSTSPEIERLLLEGINSGPSQPMTKSDWDDIRRRLVEKHGRKKAS